jgi:ATP-dependent helicase/nuclease subunit A
MSDAEARSRAAHAYDENLVVVAGAGTGKTSLLVERVLCQMVERDLGSDDFAAITFTEKAAAEMRKRIETGLARLASHAAVDRPAAELSWKHEADRAFAHLRERVTPPLILERAKQRLLALGETEITTIHGFCARLLRRFPLEAGVAPDFQVDSGGRFADLVDEMWERYLAGPTGLESEAAPGFAAVLDKLWLTELEGLARALATFALPADSLAASLPDARAVFGPWIANQLARIDSLLSGSPARGPESWLAAARRLLEVLRDRGTVAFNAALRGATFERARGSSGLLEGNAPTSTNHRAAEELADKLHARFKKLRTVDDDLLERALSLLRGFASQVRGEAQKRGILPFDALLALTRDLLANNLRVRRELSGRYRVLFLDEFQDTDPLQYEIVFFLAQDASGALPPGRLFIVGDPKQAIYRFRGADIGAYESAVRRILAASGARLSLTENFRARPEILLPLDRLLQRTFQPPGDSDESQRVAYVAYDGLRAARESVGEKRVELWKVGAQPASAREARKLEAEVIAGWIAREVGAGHFRFGSVALLFRALTDVHLYVRALQQRGVPVWVGRAEEPEKEPASQQLVALLRALANPADAPAVLGFLRSPLGGVPDAELARYGTRGGSWLYTGAHPDPGVVPQLTRAFEFLAHWHRRVRSEPLAQTLAALREETPLVALHASARDGVRREVDLSALLDRLTARAAAAPDRDLSQLVSALAREEQRRSAEEPLPDSDAVRVLSIHAAKGLEFEVVILADLANVPPRAWGDERGIELRFSRELGALAVSTRAARSSTSLERERLEESHTDAELRRLFYVATTRARERLIFSNPLRKPSAGNFAAVLADWPADPAVLSLEQLEPDPATAHARVAAGASPLETLERSEVAAARARASARPPIARPSGLAENDDDRLGSAAERSESLPPKVAAARAAASELGRALGTALHDVLERWDFRQPEAARALLPAAVTSAARLTGVEPESLTRAAQPLLETLLKSELPASLARVEILGRELPLLLRDADGKAWSGTLDLLYRDPANGRLVVADYKSDAAPDADTRASYRAQLEVYARGVARLFPGDAPPELELIWLRSGQRERLRVESRA